MIYVKNLLKLHSFKRFELVCGSAGLNRKVSWPNIAQTISIREWLVGGDVVIMTGIGLEITEAFLSDIVEQSSEGNAGCIIILLHTEHIKQIPEKTKERAEVLGVPIFAAPWETKLSILIRDISEAVFEDQYKENIVNQFMENLLSGHLDFEDSETAEQIRKYRLCGYHGVVIIRFEGSVELKAKAKLNARNREYAFVNIRMQKYFGKCYYIIRQNEMVFLFGTEGVKENQIKETFEKIHNEFQCECSRENICIGVGEIYENPRKLSKSYEQAKKAVSIARKENVVMFRELGVCQLFFEIKDSSILKKYLMDHLGGLIEYDKKHSQELVHTLDVYLRTNGGLVQTAEKLYIHRNTLIKRIDRIEQLIQMDLKDVETKNTLYNCMQIHRYIQM